mgnify:FL=1
MMKPNTADQLAYFVKLPQIRTRASNAERTAGLADKLTEELIFRRCKRENKEPGQKAPL